MMKSDLDDLAAESAQSADLAKRTALGIGGAIALVFIASMIAGYVSVVIENGGPSLTDIGIISAMAAAAALVAYGLWRLWSRTNPAEHPATGPGEARLRKRQRAQVITMVFGAILGGAIGFMTGFFDQGDGNLFAGDWDELKLSPALSLLIATMSVVVFLLMPIRGLRKADDYNREVSLIAFTGGWLAVVTAFPVWAALHAGEFVPPPHAFGLFAIAYVGMLVSLLQSRWWR